MDRDRKLGPKFMDHRLIGQEEINRMFSVEVKKAEDMQQDNNEHSAGDVKIGGKVFIAPVGIKLPKGDEVISFFDETYLFLGFIKGDVGITKDNNNIDKISVTLMKSEHTDKLIRDIYPNANRTDFEDGTMVIQATDSKDEAFRIVLDIFLEDKKYRRLVFPNAVLGNPGEGKGLCVAFGDNYYIVFSPQVDEYGNTHYEYIGQKPLMTLDPDPEELLEFFDSICTKCSYAYSDKRLLDTNTLLDLLFADNNGKEASEAAKKLCSGKRLYVSYASLWEIAEGKYPGKQVELISTKTLKKMCKKNGIEILPIKAKHIDNLLISGSLKEYRAPFSSMIFATAFSERMELISQDEKMKDLEWKTGLLWEIYHPDKE